MPDEIFCVGCGTAVRGPTCERCKTPNLYEYAVPVEHARVRLQLRAKLQVEGDPLEPAGPAGAAPPSRPPDEKEEQLPTRLMGAEDEATVRMEASPYPAKLVRVEPPGEPSQIPLALGQVVLGRKPGDADAGDGPRGVRVSGNTISRRHAEITCIYDDQGDPVVTVRDLGSMNGTFVNSRRIGDEPAELAPDDEVALGEVRYRLRMQPAG
jgi:hypothetical protein